MRKLINRWTLLGAMIVAILAGVQHRLASLPVHAPVLVSASALHTLH